MDDRVRRTLLGLFVFGCMGTGTELLLLEHNQKPWQWTPLVLLAAGLAVAGWKLFAASRAGTRAFQAVMLLFLASGMAGVLLHFRGNVEFEREMHPEGTAWELFSGAAMGATPALAPGTMILLGSIGLLYSYRHPSLGEPDPARPASEEET
jgi:hypothetical protein